MTTTTSSRDESGPEDEWAKRLVVDAIVDEAVADLARAHVLIVVDNETRATIITGPFADPLAATIAAEEERERMVSEFGPGSHLCMVRPLYAPPDPAEWMRQA